MKFIVDRHIYDLEKAEKIAEVKKSLEKYGQNPDDDWTETLYIKNHNEYFIYGVGGKHTPFNESAKRTNPNNKQERFPGRVITWKSNNLENAKLWMHDNCPEKYDEYFGENSNIKLYATSITISEKARNNLKRYSMEHEITVSEIIRRFAENLYD